MSDRTCPICAASLPDSARPDRLYCSARCLNKAREDRRKIPCAVCERLIFRTWSSLPVGMATCQGCRRAVHGYMGYKRGCRCGICRAAVAEAARGYRAVVRERDGVSLSSRRKTPTRYYWIAPAKRRAIYERDGWICQLCAEPVDATLHPNHRFAATLDHIECKSWSLIPDHSPENLRLAHRACNSRRRDRPDVQLQLPAGRV